MPKSLGTVHRGSATHRILAELERFPGSWYRWYQFPVLNDVRKPTIMKAIQRLIRSVKVDHRRVFDEDTISTAKTRGRGFWYTEIRHRDEDGSA